MNSPTRTLARSGSACIGLLDLAPYSQSKGGFSLSGLITIVKRSLKELSHEIRIGPCIVLMDGLSKHMCGVDSQIFLKRLHFLIQIIVLAACLLKTGGFARNWPLAQAKFACAWRPVVYKLYPRGRQSHATFKNLTIYATHVLNKCYPSTLCMARSNLIRRYV